MQNRYKVVLTWKESYREFELPLDANKLKIGTDIDAQFRLYKDLFFTPVNLFFTCEREVWHVACSDGLYIDIGDIRKLLTIRLENGTNFKLRYNESGNEVLSVEFLLDFECELKKYERVIDISALDEIHIGTSQECHIVLRSDFTRSDDLIIKKNNGKTTLTVNNSTYGVYHNGIKIDKTCELNNRDFFSVSDYVFFYKNNSLWTEIRKDITIRLLKFEDRAVPELYPAFVRNTRLKHSVNTEDIEILDPPSKPIKPKNHILTSLLPSFSMLVITIGMAIMGGTSMILFSAISGVVAIVTAILSITQGLKDFKDDSEKRVETYNEYIKNKKREIEGFRETERKELEKIYLSSDDEKEMALSFSSSLFDRLPEDEDFLTVRLGKGNVEALKKIKYKKQERLESDDELQQMPQQICTDEKYVRNAPVVCNLRDANAVGIIGDEKNRFSILKNIIVDISTRHYPTLVKMFFIARPENKNKIAWLRFLPHVYDEISGVRNIVCDDDSKTQVFDYLYKELAQRDESSRLPHFVIVFYNDYGINSHPLSKFISDGSKIGATFIFMADSEDKIPLGCSRLISLTSSSEGYLINTSNVADSTQFNYYPVDNDDARKIVEKLAPIYTEEISLEGTLTKSISFFEMLNIMEAEDLDLGNRWKSTDVTRSLASPIGISKSGQVSLDLHDKAHGPHGLVAGTTGSGKSEILQTYILSLATLFHPYEVSFVIIDFKGGGMVNQFRDLPHLLGAITNIDGKEIDRSLRSIKAELKKRQRLFAEADVNHIDKYIKKFKDGTVKIPLPHLILIVDEFAELKAEQPEFMKELISAARIGRSLGVHLILATQKPSGQVDDQIWSNSRFKLCLKVQSQEDSNEVLKSPLAAEIKEPGRAYLQVGNNEIFELFQSAYSGAPAKMLDSSVKEFTLYSVNESGKRTAVYARKKRKNENAAETQLDAVVEHVSSFCRDNNINKLCSICLPPLNNVIYYPDKLDLNRSMFPIGIYDDPDNQYQGEALIDIDRKNTLIIGSSQYGKTNLIQCLIRGIAEKSNSNCANIYIIDFGSMFLKNYESLLQVGGVVCPSEDEKLHNLFKLLFNQIDARKEKLTSVGVSSFSSYVEAGYTDMPQIYLIIDNLTALIELYLQDDDSLLSIIREGLAVGISTIAANPQSTNIGYRYVANFSNKIILHCNDNSEYSSLLDNVSITPNEIPGRCIIEIDKRIMECQTYLAFAAEKEIDRVSELKSLIEETNRNSDKKAIRIPYIPAILDNDSLINDFSAAGVSYNIPIGLTYSEVKPFYIDLSNLGLLGVCGKENTGHKNFISNIMSYLESIQDNYPSKVVLFDDVNRKYEEFKDHCIVEKYSLNIEDIKGILEEWHSILEDRYLNLMEKGSMGDSADMLVLIIQNNDAAKFINDDFESLERFTDITTRYKGLNVAIIFANYPNSSVSYDAPEPIRMIKQDQHLIFFEDLENLKPFDVSYDDIRANKKRVGTGDAYYIRDNAVIKLKIAKSH